MEQEETQPWNRMEGEPERDHARFLTWLDLPDRRLKEAAPRLKLKPNRVRELSARWKWRDRAAAYDLHQAQLLQEATLRHRLEATSVLTRAILQAAQTRLAAPSEDEETQDLQRLANALKALTPSLDISVTKPVPTSPGEPGDDEVAIVIRRARELMAEDDRALSR